MNKIDIALMVILIILIVGGFLVYSFYKSEAGKCIADPLGFAQETIGNNSICSCYNFGSLSNPSISYCANKCPG